VSLSISCRVVAEPNDLTTLYLPLDLLIICILKLPEAFFFERTNITKFFGTPKNNILLLIYNKLQGCPEKMRKTGNPRSGNDQKRTKEISESLIIRLSFFVSKCTCFQININDTKKRWHPFND